MGADLRVTSVVLPSPLQAPCSVLVQVTVTNAGADPADPVSFIVAVDLRSGESTTQFRTRVPLPEGGQLAPGGSTDVVVRVRFPCTAPVDLTATADAAHQVPNNDRTAPSQTLLGLVPTQVPSLVTTMRVGITDGHGIVSWDPIAFCPGKTVAVEVVVTNQGCVPSRRATTDVTLEDATTSPVTVLANQAYALPGLAPGGSHSALLNLPAPGPGTGTSVLTVHAEADSKNDNPDLCDRAMASALTSRPLATGGPPRLALSVGGAGSVHPGEAPELAWSITNECSDIGVAHVSIQYGAPPTTLYDTWLTIPPQATVGEGLYASDLAIPSSIASAFWAIGTQTLELVVTGNGTDGGPYQVSAPLAVIPESITPGWWFWTGPAAAAWKSSYTLGFTLKDAGSAAMAITAMTITEHPTDVPDLSQDALVPILTSPPIPVLPGAPALITLTRRPAWTWIANGTAVEVGPQSRTFSYTAAFTLTDVFGNVYPSVTSTTKLVTVSVSPAKVMSRDIGAGFIGAGLALLALAVLAGLGGGPYGWIVAVALAAAGMSLIIVGQLSLYLAFDPPIPDFRDELPSELDPAAWTVPDVADDEVRPLGVLAHVLTRAASAQVRAIGHRDLAWAAYVDLDEPRLARHRDAAGQELERLRRATLAARAAADEAGDVFDRITSESRTLPSIDDLQATTTRLADELGLSARERTIVTEWVGTLAEPDRLEETLENLRSGTLSSVGTLLDQSYRATATDLAQREHLQLPLPG